MMKDSYELYGYTFYTNGKVINPKGVEIKRGKDKYGGNYIYIYKEKYQKKVYIAKTLYCLVNGIKKLPKGFIVSYKDGDKDNCAYENLELTPISEWAKTYNHSRNQGRRVLTKEQVAEIQQKYKNYDGHMKSQWGKDSPSIRDLAEEYGVSAYTVQKVLNDTYY